jgi:hypothetical protein
MSRPKHVARAGDAAPLGLPEGRVEVHRHPGVGLVHITAQRHHVHDREDPGVAVVDLLLGVVVAEEAHHLATREAIRRVERDALGPARLVRAALEPVDLAQVEPVVVLEQAAGVAVAVCVHSGTPIRAPASA